VLWSGVLTDCDCEYISRQGGSSFRDLYERLAHALARLVYRATCCTTMFVGSAVVLGGLHHPFSYIVATSTPEESLVGRKSEGNKLCTSRLREMDITGREAFGYP
jgi:O-acetyl-ADP-ribose deacetylase (regulator of RNase III)